MYTQVESEYIKHKIRTVSWTNRSYVDDLIKLANSLPIAIMLPSLSAQVSACGESVTRPTITGYIQISHGTSRQSLFNKTRNSIFGVFGSHGPNWSRDFEDDTESSFPDRLGARGEGGGSRTNDSPPENLGEPSD